MAGTTKRIEGDTMKTLILLFLLVGLTFSQNTSKKFVIVEDSIQRLRDSSTAANTYAADDVINDSTSYRFSRDSINSSGAYVTTLTDTTLAPKRKFRFKYAATQTKGSGAIYSSTLIIADTVNIANGTMRLYLFTDTVLSYADNAAWVATTQSNEKCIGYIDYTLTTNGSGAAIAQVNNLFIPFTTSVKDQYIYGVLVARAAYKAKIAGKIKVKLGIERE
jgi:hypothetical protein